MAAMMVPLVMLFRRADTSSSVPSWPQPVASAVSAPVSLPSPSWTLAEAVRTPHFWLLFAVYLFTGLGSFLVSLHQLAFAVDRGFDKLYAAEVLGTGSSGDRRHDLHRHALRLYWPRSGGDPRLRYFYHRRRLCPVHHRTVPGLAVMAVRLLFRADLGRPRTRHYRQDSRPFSGRQLGTILGVITIGSGIGSAVGSWAAGWIFDLSGSYEPAFTLSIASYVCGCVAFWALRRPPARYTEPTLRRAGD